MSDEEKKEILAVVRVRRGEPRQAVKHTLQCLNLTGINSCVLCANDKRGMLKKAKDYITYGKINQEMLSQLLATANVEKSEQAAEDLIADQSKLKQLQGPYRLSPPSKGYKDTKRPYQQGGSLGNRAKDINLLLKRMV